MLPGSLGVLPSSSQGIGSNAIYEPIHGSAPDIAGKNIANPFGMVLSAAMMLRQSFNLNDEAANIEQAVESAMNNGDCTADLGGTLTTSQVGDELCTLIG
jgi:3-isopropylmalate dehydrogenase